MRKIVLVFLLVALLLSLTLAIVGAGMDFEDPCTPGAAHSNHAKCFTAPPPGLVGNDHGKAGDNWLPPR